MSTSPKAFVAAAVAAASLASSAPLAAGTSKQVPISCSRGPSGQHFDVVLTAPAIVAEGGTYTVRIDGIDSGRIEHTGLHYIFDMSTDYTLPAGATYVEGSARIVPGTGSANVAQGARVWRDGNKITLTLPGHVDSGTSYTPPSIEFQLKATASANASLSLGFFEYRVTANAFLVGDVHTTCSPSPKPYTISTTRVAAAP